MKLLLVEDDGRVVEFVKSGLLASDPLTNVVEVYIRHLRRKIDTPDTKPIIHTVRGFGLKKEWMILEELLTEAMRAVRAMWPQPNLKLERDEAAEACVVTGDQQRLRQLFTILLDNAVKYSGDRQPMKI